MVLTIPREMEGWCRFNSIPKKMEESMVLTIYAYSPIPILMFVNHNVYCVSVFLGYPRLPRMMGASAGNLSISWQWLKPCFPVDSPIR